MEIRNIAPMKVIIEDFDSEDEEDEREDEKNEIFV